MVFEQLTDGPCQTCLFGMPGQTVTSIGAAALRERLTIEPAPLLLDVCEPGELHGGLGRLPVELAAQLEARERSEAEDVVARCRSGGRADTATQLLQQAGFRQVLALDSDMEAWLRQGFDGSREAA